MPKNKALEELRKNLQTQMNAARAKGAAPLASAGQSKGGGNPRGNKTDLDPAREGHAGRRGDILEAFNKKTGDYAGRDGAARPPLLIKVSIAGSGFEVWKTHREADKTVDTKLARIDDPDLDSLVTGSAPRGYVNEKGDATFSGPLGLGNKGVFDQGKNSIDNLAQKVPGIILKSIPADYSSGKDVIVIIKAHSRGAVAASMIAKKLKEKMPESKIELTQFDPVPGPGQTGKKLEIAVGDYKKPGTGKTKDVKTANALDESTVIYSMGSGYALPMADLGFFTPQKVHGAKRIIVSGQGHGGGLEKGFMLDGEPYKGARVNSLPPGAYHDVGVMPDGVMEIMKMSKDDFMTRLGFMKDMKVEDADRKRYSIVKKALEEFFAKNG